MFQDIKVQDVLLDAVYHPVDKLSNPWNTRITYDRVLAGLEEDLSPKAVQSFRDQTCPGEPLAQVAASLLAFAINEGPAGYCRATPALPLNWIGLTKFALLHNYLPSNFYTWSRAILEWFDLDRYRHAHQLRDEEYDLIKSDLQAVLSQLQHYSPSKLQPAWAEDIWGMG
jgi:hypothetical protein